MLADQNAELIDKLEQLEAESVKADQAGKRKLRKLEQEIQTLREELESTQARGVELEEQAKAATHAVAIQKRKEEREARLQALKRSTTAPPDSDAPEEEVRDFAPPSWMPSRSSPVKRSVSASTFASTHSVGSDQAYERALGIPPMEQEGLIDEDPESYFPDSHTSTASRDRPPQAEFAIVSQLLAKIGELERTNAEIKEQQKLTEERRRAAQWDAESIRRVYDWLDEDDVDLEIQEEDSDPRPSSSKLGIGNPNGTIRFSSIRRSIVGDMQRLRSSESDIFAEGISREMQSTTRHSLLKGTGASKTRKTVVGLFDRDPDSSAASPPWGQYPPSLKVSPAFRSMDGDISGWSSSATDGVAPPSPTMSTLQTPLDGPRAGRSLGSELGSEFGDDWAEHGINHHLRATSLADLAALYSSPASPNESIAVLPPIVFPTSEEQEDWDRAGPSTPPPPKLQIEPPTPTPDKLLRSPSAVRQYRLSQTVRSRTNRWVEVRFQQSLVPQQPKALSEKALSKRPSLSTLGRKSSAVNLLGKAAPGILTETFDNAVGQIKRVASRGSFSPLGFGAVSTDASSGSSALPQDELTTREDDNEDAQGEHEGDRSISLRPDASVGDPLDRKHDGIVGFVLEAWLWLQFIIVVALFLWAMAKRGPKVVLEAERRSAHRAVPKS